MDNAANNTTFLASLYKTLNTRNPSGSLQPLQAYIRCFPHVVNLVTQTMIKALDTPGRERIPDLEEINNSDDSDDEREDQDGGNQDSDSSDEDDAEPTVGVVSKIRRLVRTIRASDQRQSMLTRVVEMGNKGGLWTDYHGKTVQIEPRQLILDVRTRWDSTYQMLVRAAEFLQVH
jgi:hypothetical protein